MTGMPEDPRKCPHGYEFGDHHWFGCMGVRQVAEGASEAVSLDDLTDHALFDMNSLTWPDPERAAYERGKAEQAAAVERLQLLLEHAEQYARDLQDEAGWDRTEEWALRYRVNGGEPQVSEDNGIVFETRAEAQQHIEAWQRHYPTLTYTDVEYLRREVLTGEWQPEPSEASDAQ